MAARIRRAALCYVGLSKGNFVQSGREGRHVERLGSEAVRAGSRADEKRRKGMWTDLGEEGETPDGKVMSHVEVPDRGK